MPENPMDILTAGMPEPSEFAESIPIPDEAMEPTAGVDAAPEVSPSSVEAAPPAVESIDDYVFNPAIHTPGKDGFGTKTASGKYRRKKGFGNSHHGVGNSHHGTGATINTPSVAGPAALDAVKLQKAKAAAQVCTAATFVVGQVVCGPEGAPLILPEHGVNEPVEFETAYTQAFYLAKNPIEIPPWVIVCLVLGNYVARRAAMPGVQNRWVGVWKWLKERQAKWVRGE